MMRTIVALYDDFDVAKDVVEDIVEAGFKRESISLMANDVAGEYALNLNRDVEMVGESDVSGAEGASFGAVVGGLVGLGAMLIPGVGPVIAAGPLVAALVGAGVGVTAGAVTGGITASLVDLGVDDEYAGYYAEGVRRGGTLVVAHAEDNWEDRVRDIMSRHNPVDMSTRSSTWKESGWSGFDEASKPYTSEQVSTERARYRTPDMGGVRVNTYTTAPASGDYITGDQGMTYQPFESYNDEYRTHYTTTFGAGGHPFDYYVPAYRYGYMLATDPRYNNYQWEALEPEIRRNWEDYNKDTWEDVKDAIRHAWDNICKIGED
jgi:uncharacterized membrane protein